MPAQVSASSYRSPVEPALSLKNELEAYDRHKDRRVLLGALKEQFLLNRLVAASQAENTRKLALQTLFNRMERMSDKTLLKAIRMLSEIGSLDLTAIAGTEVTGGQTRVGLPGGRLPAFFRRSLNVQSGQARCNADGTVRANCCSASARQGDPSYRTGGQTSAQCTRFDPDR